MPTFSFRNNDTQEVWDKLMSNSKKEEFLAANPHIKQIHTGSGFLGIGDPVRLGLKKPDAGFRDVLKNITSHHPGSRNIKNTINDF